MHRFILGLGALLAALVLLWPATALAHRVTLLAWSDSSNIITESAYADNGKPVTGGTVEVLCAKSDHKLLEGVTDAQGRFSFPIPPLARERRMNLKLVLYTGMGHQGEQILPAEDYLGPAPAQAAAQSLPADSAAASQNASVCQEALVRMVDEALDRKLAPLAMVLARQAEALARKTDSGPGVAEIFGGLGWILGLVGVAAFFRSRRNGKS